MLRALLGSRSQTGSSPDRKAWARLAADVTAAKATTVRTWLRSSPSWGCQPSDDEQLLIGTDADCRLAASSRPRGVDSPPALLGTSGRPHFQLTPLNALAAARMRFAHWYLARGPGPEVLCSNGRRARSRAS